MTRIVHVVTTVAFLVVSPALSEALFWGVQAPQAFQQPQFQPPAPHGSYAQAPPAPLAATYNTAPPTTTAAPLPPPPPPPPPPPAVACIPPPPPPLQLPAFPVAPAYAQPPVTFATLPPMTFPTFPTLPPPPAPRIPTFAELFPPPPAPQAPSSYVQPHNGYAVAPPVAAVTQPSTGYEQPKEESYANPPPSSVGVVTHAPPPPPPPKEAHRPSGPVVEQQGYKR